MSDQVFLSFKFKIDKSCVQRAIRNQISSPFEALEVKNQIID